MKALALWTQSFITVLALSLPLDAAPNTAPSFTLPAGVNGPAGATWTARDSARNWVSITSSADGSKLATATGDGQIYTSTDSGVTWTEQNSDNAFWWAITSSADGSKLAAVAYDGQIYTSTDSGVTWMARNSGTRYWVSITSSADGSKLAAVVEGGQIYTSTDSGETWTARDSDRNWWSITSSADGSKLAAIVPGGKIYTSTDSGETWTERDSDRSWYSITSSADGSKLAAVVLGGQIYTSTDSGVTWTARDSDRQWYSITSSADGSKLAAAAFGGQIYTSTDSGVTWTARDSDRDWYIITSSADGSKLAAVALGGLIYTSVGDTTPYNLSVDAGSGPQTTPGFATEISPGPVAEAGQTVSFTVTNNNNGLFTTQPAIASNGTLTFTPGSTPGVATVTVTAVDNGGTADGGVDTSAPQTFTITLQATVPGAPTIGTATAGNASASVAFTAPASDGGSAITGYTVTSSPGGLTGTGAASPITVNGLTNGTPYTFTVTATNSVGTGAPSAASNSVTPMVPVPNTAPSFTLPAGVNNPAGETWTARESNRSWQSITSSEDGSKLAAVVNGGQIYTSTDSGVTWTAQNSGNRNWTSITSSADGSKLAAVGGQIYTSTDSGVTWTAQNSGNRSWSSITSSADGSKLAAAVRNGGQIYTSTDSGETWTAQNSGNRNWTSITSSADGSKLAAVVNEGEMGGQIYTSTDSGVTWTAQNSGNREWTSITSSADGSRLAAVAQFGQIFTSTDSGVTWTVRGSVGIWSSITSSADGSKLAAVAQHGQIYTSTDSGVSWTARDSNRIWTSITSSADGSKLAAVVSNGQIYTSVGSSTPYNLSVDVGSGPQTTPTFATEISPGPVADAGQTVSFTVTNDNNGLFTTQPAIASNGTLTFTPGSTPGVATVTVTAVDNGGTADGGVDTSAPQTFTITLQATVPGAPTIGTATAGNASASVAFTAPASDGGSAITGYTVTSSPGGLTGTGVASPITVNGLTNGTPYTFTVTATNAVGTGAPSAASNSVTPMVPNFAPTDITLTPSSIAENNAANAVVGTLDAVDADVADTHVFELVSGAGDDDNTSFDIDGTSLKILASADFETKSSYSIRVRATDSGEENLTFTKALTINITNVNEMPSFLKGADQLHTASTAAHSVSGWATAIDDGDSTVVQTVSFEITENTTPGLFTTAPAVAADGTLSYTLSGTTGVATITLRIMDDTSIGGQPARASPTQSFTITNQAAPDYTVVTTPTTVTVTDISGNSDTLSFTDGGAHATVAAAGRTFSLNGALNVTDSLDLTYASLTGITRIVIDAGGGNDTVDIGDFSAAGSFPSLTVHGGTGDDTVNFNGDITFVADANLDVDLQNDDATPGTDTVNVAANANLVTSGTGSITVKVSRNVALASGSSLETVNGGITIEANQQGSATSGSFVGVDVNNGLIQATGAGDVTVWGKGGNSGDDQIGVLVQADGDISGGDSGQLSVVGTGGASTGAANHGVVVHNTGSAITSGGGAVSVTGIEGSSTGSAIAVADSGSVSATNGGTLTLTADSMSFDGSSEISAGAASSVTLRQLTHGTAINLGAADSAGTLGLTDAELDRISAGTLVIGDADTGSITLTDVISPQSYPVLSLAQPVTFASGGGFESDITSESVFERMIVDGGITLEPGSGFSGTLLGGFVPSATAVIPIIQGNDGVTGTFTGLPEGSPVSIINLERKMRLTYAADGGDSIAFYSAPIMVLRGNSVAIAKGDSTPSSADHTDFGGTLTAGSNTVVRTFEIFNDGLAPLTGISPDVGTGAPAGEFSLTASPAATLISGASTTFSVTFDPAANGIQTSTVTVTSDEPLDSPFTFAIQGEGTYPEIVVFDGTLAGTELVDDTGEVDFGDVERYTTGTARLFTIRNIGTGPMSGIAVTKGVDGLPAEFGLDTSGLSTSLLPNTSTTFTVALTPGSLGERSAVLEIASTDEDENPFEVNVIGRGVPPEFVTRTDEFLRADQGLQGGGRIYRPLSGVINQQGFVTFRASGAVGTGSITSGSDGLLLSDVSGSIRVVAREGHLVEVSPWSTLMGTFAHFLLTEDGQSIALDRIAGAPSTSDYAYIASPDGIALEILSREGDAAPSAGTFKTHTGKPAADSLGRVYFSGDLTGTGITTRNDSGIYQESGGTLVEIVREGNDVSALTGDPAWLGAVGAMVAAAGDGVAFTALLQNNPADAKQRTNTARNAVVMAGNESALQILARKGDAVPALSGATMRSFSGVSRGAADSHAFLGLMNTGSGITTANDQVLVAVTGTGSHLVAREGVTQADGVTLVKFGDFYATSSGAVIFEASGVLCRWTEAGGIVVLARIGGLAPGGASTHNTFTSLSVSQGGAVALLTHLANGSRVLWRALPGEALSAAISTNDPVAVDGGTLPLLGLDIYNSGTGTGGGGGGMGSAINDEGYVYVTLSLGGSLHVGKVLP